MPDFHIVTLFPNFFDSPLQASLLGRAAAQGHVSFSFHDPREYSQSRHPYVDDAPYGGGVGMVMRALPVASAIRSIENPGRILNLTPAGRPLTNSLAKDLALEKDITLVCGRYEGIDARLSDLVPPMEDVSVGEAVLNGGETAALAVIESVLRFTEDFLGNPTSAEEETFSSGLLEYPQYTRPENVEGHKVPEILLSGHHARIAVWRREAALRKTLECRPELLRDAHLSKDDVAYMHALSRGSLGRNLSFALIHNSVRLEGRRIGCSSLTNLDIHDIGRISRSYGLDAFYVVTQLQDQLALLEGILNHWVQGRETDRRRALELVHPVTDFTQLESITSTRYGVRPLFVATSVHWPKRADSLYSPGEVRTMLQDGPVVICFGTAKGLSEEAINQCDGQLAPVRFLGDSHLSVRSAAAIVADRILGDFH